MTDIKIGDVVAWADIHPMTMVRVDGDADHELRPPAYAIRTAGGLGMWVYDPLDPDDAAEWTVDQDVWRWESAALGGCLPKGERVTIIALGLTGEESADDLRRLAEVFEVREALGSLDPFDMPADLAHMLEEQAEDDEDEARNTLARILHAAGWRPGMTAEDAARLLAAREGSA